MFANWNYPTTMRVGEGRVAEIAQVCGDFNISAPLLVTDPGIAALSMTDDILEHLHTAGLPVELFSDVKPNPTGSNVTEGARVYRKNAHDGVIALGGGSSLDAGKAVAVIAHQSCGLWDLEDVEDNWRNADAERIPPVIAIPTTAGTGSEVGRASVILNEDEERKVIIFHPKMLPSCVILDPSLTIGLPPGLTAATGMDALSHNLEAFCSPLFHPLAEGIAIEGIRLIKGSLPLAVSQGSNCAARRQMLVASSMGATAFQRGLGGMHALAHPLGAIYNAHHGMLNAILMPYILVANRSAIAPQIGRLARYLELPATFDGFLEWILSLRHTIGIPHDLAAIGIDDHRIDDIGQMAVKDPSADTNPINHDVTAYSRILSAALHGTL